MKTPFAIVSMKWRRAIDEDSWLFQLSKGGYPNVWPQNGLYAFFAESV